nr:transposase [Chromatium okenii]
MYPDAYLQERADRLQVSKSGIGTALGRLGISRKKTFSHPKVNDQARFSFQERVESHKSHGKTVVYIDESGFANDMPRSYGYASIGKQCLDKRNWHEKGRINAIGAIADFSLLTVTL